MNNTCIPGCTLDYHKVVDDFVGQNRDICTLELMDQDWEAITQVASWLKAF
jgi:hypothetical protein